MSQRIGTLAAAFTGIQVGGAMLATRALGDSLGPATLALARYAVALAVLAVPFLILRRSVIPLRDLVLIMVIGAGQFGLLVALLNFGLQRVPAAPAALTFAAMPALALAVAVLAGAEAMGPRKMIALVLVTAGVALALGPAAVGGADPLGLAAILGAALTGAVTAVAARPVLRRYPTLQVGTLAMVAAVASLGPLALAEAPTASVAALSGHQVALVLGIGLSSGAGYILWLTALRYLEPARASLFLGLSPVLAVLAAPAVLGEPATPSVWGGLSLVLGGLVAAVPPGGRRA